LVLFVEHECIMAGFPRQARLFFNFFRGDKHFFKGLSRKISYSPQTFFRKGFKHFILLPNNEEFFTIPYRNHPNEPDVLPCSNDSPRRIRGRRTSPLHPKQNQLERMSWDDVRNQSQVDLLGWVVRMIIPVDFFGGGATKQQPTNE